MSCMDPSLWGPVPKHYRTYLYNIFRAKFTLNQGYNNKVNQFLFRIVSYKMTKTIVWMKLLFPCHLQTQ